MGRWCAVGSVLESAAVAQHLLLKGFKEQGVWS